MAYPVRPALGLAFNIPASCSASPRLRDYCIPVCLANLSEHGQSLHFAGTRHPGCDSCVAIDLYGSKHDRRLKFWLIDNVTFRIVRGYHVRGYHVSRTLMVFFFLALYGCPFYVASVALVPPTPLVTLCVSHARHCLPL